jgi:NAD(P) transhydrogenase subunit alpha
MRLAVPKEVREGETRVAATPESVKKFKGLGLDVVVEAGAGAGAKISDADYTAAGAMIAPDAAATFKDADIVLKVRGPSAAEISQLKNGAVLAALLAPHAEGDAIQASPPSPWSSCRAFPAPSRWTCCRPRRTWPATRR